MTEAQRAELYSSKGRKLLEDYLNEQKLDCIDVFDKITDLYGQVNSVINISALKSYDDIYIKHYLDSIYPYKYFKGTVCDVGCGGGFPCLPLAVVTGLDITGLESVGKKLTLIKRCVSELGIINIKPEYSRAEDLAKKCDGFDTVCARALADIDKAISFCAPLAKKGGQILLYRTQNDRKADISAENKYKITLKDVIDYTLPRTDIARRLFIYQK